MLAMRLQSLWMRTLGLQVAVPGPLTFVELLAVLSVLGQLFYIFFGVWVRVQVFKNLIWDLKCARTQIIGL